LNKIINAMKVFRNILVFTLFIIIANRTNAQKANNPLNKLTYLGKITPKSSKEIEQSYWGIQSGTLDYSKLKYAGKIGVKWTRIMAHWPEVEKEKNVYNWNKLDAALGSVLNEKIVPFVSITGGNTLYTKLSTYDDPKLSEIYGYKPGPPVDNETAMLAWDNYVISIVNRYKDKITYWEIWNEPNHRNYWGAEPDAKKYGILVNRTALLIKKLQPNAHIIAGAMAGLSAEFIDGFLSQNNKDLIEIISYHNYDIIPETRIYKADSAWRIINKYNSKIELWQGECGTPSHSSTRDYRSTSPWGINIQAKWLLRQSFTDIYFCKASMSNYFKLADEGKRDQPLIRKNLTALDSILGYPERNGSRVKEIGVNEKCLLSNPDLTPKPGYYAYQNLCATIDKNFVPVALKHKVLVKDEGMFYGIGSGDDAFPSIPLVAPFKTKDGKYAIAYWLAWHPQEYTPNPATVNLVVEKVRMKEPVLVDLLSGKTYALKNISYDNGNMLISNIPLLDYPFLIMEKNSIVYN
jgi:hypothetical protein